MKILFLAPQPFYQERGTPIAVRMLVTELARRGWDIDLLTFHEGDALTCPNVRMFRIPRLPGIHRVQPGLSVKKLICDVVFFFKAIGMLRRIRYDAVHAVEEAVFMAALLRPFFRTPYICDMDSSLPEQVVMKCPALRVFSPLFRWMESAAIRKACVVVPVCDALADIARLRGAQRVLVLRDPPLNAPDPIPGGRPAPTAPAGAVRFMYIGNLASYQGIDLLLAAFARLTRTMATATLTVIGGSASEVEEYREKCRGLHISHNVEFAGAQPIARMSEFMGSADVMVSPRIEGVNTPMKLYSYLQAGKAILATDIPAHTQVLTPEVALLVAPQPEKLADGMERLAADPNLRSRLGAQAALLAREHYSLAAYQRCVDEFCRLIEANVSPRGT